MQNSLSRHFRRAAVSLFLIAVSSGVASAETKGEYNNLCAIALTKGMDVPTDCSTNWKDPNSGRTYCFSSAGAKSAWAADPAGNVVKAEQGYRAAVARMQAKAQAEEQKQKAVEQAKAAQDRAAKAMGEADKALGDAKKAQAVQEEKLKQLQGSLAVPVPGTGK